MKDGEFSRQEKKVRSLTRLLNSCAFIWLFIYVATFFSKLTMFLFVIRLCKRNLNVFVSMPCYSRYFGILIHEPGSFYSRLGTQGLAHDIACSYKFHELGRKYCSFLLYYYIKIYLLNVKINTYNKLLLQIFFQLKMKSNAALNSVNKITDTIKMTFEKGNKLIRSDKNFRQSDSLLNSGSKQKINLMNSPTAQQQINALVLFENLKASTSNNQKVQKNIINILNFAQQKWLQLLSIPSKSGHDYNSSLHTFKKIYSLFQQNLSHLISNAQSHQTKQQLKRIIEYLTQRSKKFVDKNRQISIVQDKEKQDNQQESQEEQIKEEMIQLLDRIKTQALYMGSDLKKDNIVIDKIHKKQDKQLNVLSSKSNSLQEMINSQRIGFFKLLSMAGIGIVAWIFTLLFIIIF